MKLAEANGCLGLHIEKKTEVRSTIDRAMQVNDRPVILEFMVEEAEDCWPMIAPGKSHDQMLGTYETLKDQGGVAQYRHLEPDEEAKLSLG